MAPQALPSASTIARARALRARMTDAERKLWFALRDRRFANFKFRRQVPVGPFVADFVCYHSRVVIEVDGGQHAESSSDERRDRWFASNETAPAMFSSRSFVATKRAVLERTGIREDTDGQPASGRAA